MRGHSAWVSAFELLADGRRVILASADRTLKVWGLEIGQELQTLKDFRVQRPLYLAIAEP